MAQTKPISALSFLHAPDKHAPTPICVAFGGDAFLRREAITTMRERVIADAAGAEISPTTLEGKDLPASEVFDALRTISLFGGGTRLVIVNDAESFVSEFRDLLLNYADKPARDAILILETKTWAGNTKLAKQLASAKWLAIDCSPPDAKGAMNATVRRTVRDWMVGRATQRHKIKVSSSAADMMIELVSCSPGLLDSELSKLAGVVGDDGEVTPKIVETHVGDWRTRTVWEMIDAVADGAAAEAIRQLDRLLTAGESPHAIFPMLASTLRKFAAAGRAYLSAERNGRKISPSAALKDAGMPPFKLGDAERQFRQIGRVRAVEIRRWLLEADLAIKSSHSNADRPRMVLEQLIGRLSLQCQPPRV